MAKKRKRAPRRLWAPFDAEGELFGTYLTESEAVDDAVGPRFQPRFTIRAYDLVAARRDPRAP